MPKTQSPDPDTPDTRTSLVRSAVRLFAEKGLGAVSVKDITREAGARNPSAVYYHFGSVEELIKEVFVQRFTRIERQRLQLFAALDRQEPAQPLIALMEAALTPLMTTCLDEDGRRYVRFCLQFASDPRFDINELVDEVSLVSLEILSQRLVQNLPNIPVSTIEARFRHGFLLSLVQAADYALQVEQGTAPPVEDYVRECACGLAGFFAAPVA